MRREHVLHKSVRQFNTFSAVKGEAIVHSATTKARIHLCHDTYNSHSNQCVIWYAAAFCLALTKKKKKNNNNNNNNKNVHICVETFEYRQHWMLLVPMAANASSECTDFTHCSAIRDPICTTDVSGCA